MDLRIVIVLLSVLITGGKNPLHASICINMYYREIIECFSRSFVFTQGRSIRCYACESRGSDVCEETIRTCPDTHSCASTAEKKYSKSRLIEWK